MPMLALTISGRPSATNGCSRSWRIFRAASSARFDVRGRQQHRELVAAQSGHRVGRPQSAAQPHRHFLQHLIAGVVAERVVHFLEAVEIDQQHGEAALVTMRSQDSLLQPVLEQRPIGQVGQ